MVGVIIINNYGCIAIKVYMRVLTIVFIIEYHYKLVGT